MNPTDLVRTASNYFSFALSAPEQRAAGSQVETFWKDMTTPEKAALVAVPLILIGGAAICCLSATWIGWRCICRRPARPPSREDELHGLVSEPVPRRDSVLAKFAQEAWFHTTNAIGRDARIPPTDPSAGKCYKHLRNEVYPRLRNRGVWTTPENLPNTDLCLSLLYVSAGGVLEEIRKVQDDRTEYLSRDKRYTAVILFDFFDFYRRAFMGLKTVTSQEGIESLRKTKGFDQTNFNSFGTSENRWSIWRDEILGTLESLFSEEQLRQSGLQEMIDQGFPATV